ncbi:TetR/AcrR family transcriptional regulator [Paenibacillus sp. J22TS3]|uniref:TetR/AcrR family transcriptional regulator n=1 Tax=Paenibacillus sp. J22TS3 TaxID=2807192 RepID=UPI001B131579|nr:TetR/AcrR family transcriptional regulator [Paenibacillus sp. J22TS3]GIP21142.1 TetR family transcriptional regulator [Paenibacillus sp. J22TS3]
MTKKRDDKPSFITEARRRQIVDAAISTLDEIGYIHTSLAQIAKRAGISTALISYHFKDKQDLMDYTLMMLLTNAAAHVIEQTRNVSTARGKLHAYIKACMDYQCARPQYNTALIEIIFHARTPDNVPYYRLSDDEDDSLTSLLHQILQEGQARGEFRQFNVIIVASAIRGAIDEFLFNKSLSGQVSLESYSNELAAFFEQAVLAEI